jgi:hypothetical protein
MVDYSSYRKMEIIMLLRARYRWLFNSLTTYRLDYLTI